MFSIRLATLYLGLNGSFLALAELLGVRFGSVTDGPSTVIEQLKVSADSFRRLQKGALRNLQSVRFAGILVRRENIVRVVVSDSRSGTESGFSLVDEGVCDKENMSAASSVFGRKLQYSLSSDA
jgi:hypothetical protein